MLRSPVNIRSVSDQCKPATQLQYTSNPHIYSEVGEASGNKNPTSITNWPNQDLPHPLCQSSSEDNPPMAMQMSTQPIRNPIIAHQKYLTRFNGNNSSEKYCNSTNKTNDSNDNRPSILSQDCSMSSYSSSGYDSMTQSPPLSNRNQRTLPITIDKQYSTNYDNVRGHFRGPFVSYTNNRS